MFRHPRPAQQFLPSVAAAVEKLPELLPGDGDAGVHPVGLVGVDRLLAHLPGEPPGEGTLPVESPGAGLEGEQLAVHEGLQKLLPGDPGTGSRQLVDLPFVYQLLPDLGGDVVGIGFPPQAISRQQNPNRKRAPQTRPCLSSHPGETVA